MTEEIQELSPFVKAIHEANSTEIFMNLQIGHSDGLPFLRESAMHAICRSRDLVKYHNQALQIIQAVRLIFDKYSQDDYDKLINSGESFEALTDFLADQQAKQQAVKSPVDREKKIYIMLNEHTGYYKIGQSQNPAFREQTLQSQEPSVKLIHTFPGRESDEKALHLTFVSKRIRGEWFALDQLDIRSIESYFNPQHNAL